MLPWSLIHKCSVRGNYDIHVRWVGPIKTPFIIKTSLKFANTSCQAHIGSKYHVVVTRQLRQVQHLTCDIRRTPSSIAVDFTGRSSTGSGYGGYRPVARCDGPAADEKSQT